MSAVFHAALGASIIFLSQLPSCRSDIGGDEGESFREVGIHVRSTESDETDDSESETSEDASELTYESPLTVPEPVTDSSPPVPLQLPEMTTFPNLIGPGSVPNTNLGAQDDLLKPNQAVSPNPTGSGSGQPIAGGTSFLGIQDVGKSFVYVIDYSFSMENDGALQAAKNELLASLSRLDETQKFQIIFYNNEFQVLQPRDGRFEMFWGTDSQRLQVSSKLRSISAKGGTNHMPALRKALEFKPDVIFLLTDGDSKTALKSSELNELKQRNRSGTRIHCIEFGRGSRPAVSGAGNFLKQLATQNHGQYTYRNVKRVQ